MNNFLKTHKHKHIIMVILVKIEATLINGVGITAHLSKLSKT